LSPLAGTLKARARVTLAGAIIACVALGALLLVIGIFDEAQGVAARRGGTGAVGLLSLGLPCHRSHEACRLLPPKRRL
jgi:hypothetical protein